MEVPPVGQGVLDAAPPLPAAPVPTAATAAPPPLAPPEPRPPEPPPPLPVPVQRAALTPVEPPVISREQMIALILAAVAGTS